MRASFKALTMLHRIRRVSRLGAGAAVVALVLALEALAHDVQPPTPITLRPGGKGSFYVVDQFGCEATITATSQDPSLVKVYAVNMGNPTSFLPGTGATITVPNRVDQAFEVRAASGVTGSQTVLIAVCWVGDTAPNPPCPENNCNPPAPHYVVVNIDAKPDTIDARPFSGIVGDPVTSDDAELFFEEDPDIARPGPLSVVVQRRYASLLAREGNSTGSLGPNWTSNFDWRMEFVGGNAEIFTPTGRVIRFERGFAQAAWQLAVFEDLPYQLVDSGFNKVLGDPRTGARRTFDPSGKLTSFTDGKGNTLTLTYTGANLTQASDGLGRTLNFSYVSGRLASVTDGTRTATFGYTAGVLTSATNGNGETTTYVYDPANPGEALLTSRMRPEGNVPWTQTYDVSDRVDTQTDAFANTSSLAIGTPANATTITNPLGDDQVHTHSSDSELTRLEDEAGQDATMQYDAFGRRTSVTDRLGRRTSWTIHAPSGQLASATEADGTTTTFTYTARAAAGMTVYDMTRIAYAGATNENFDYDASGNLTTWTDAASNDWLFTHDARGQALTETNPAGGVTTFTYNANATLATAMDHAGNVTSFAYDALRRLQTITRPGARTIAYTYDALDRVLSVTDELSQVTTMVYDLNGNLVSLIDPSAQTWNFVYDAMDRLVSATDPLGNSAACTFDALGRLATLANGAGNELAFVYDALGRLVSIADELGNDWSATYDAEGIPTGKTDPLSNASTATTDSMGRPTALTNALGERVQYAYDPLGRVKQVRDPLGHATNVVYDTRGLFERITLPVAGMTTSVVRNALGSITTVDRPGATDWNYGYDAQGRLVSVTDPLGRTTTLTYDARNLVDLVTYPGTVGSMDLTWDAADRLVRKLYSDGTDLQYAYDASGRLVSANGLTFTYDAAGRIVESNGLIITRDAAGRIASIEVAPGKVVTYAYDERGLVISVTDWVGGSTTFGYDSAGRLTTITRPNNVVTTFEYDADGRVTRILEQLVSPLTAELPTTTLSEIVAGYNARGEVTNLVNNTPRTVVPMIGSTNYSYDAAGQVVGWDYDELGRLKHRDDFYVNQDRLWCNWDAASRPVQIRIEARIVAFDYDGLNQVIGRHYMSLDEVFVRDCALENAPIATYRRNGVDATYFVHDPAGGVLHSVDAVSNARSFYAFDLTYSTNFLTDDSGAVTDSYAYSPTGTELAHNGTSSNLFTYRGHRSALRETRQIFIDAGMLDTSTNKSFGIDFNPVPDRVRVVGGYDPSNGNPLSDALTASSNSPNLRLRDPLQEIVWRTTRRWLTTPNSFVAQSRQGGAALSAAATASADCPFLQRRYGEFSFAWFTLPNLAEQPGVFADASPTPVVAERPLYFTRPLSYTKPNGDSPVVNANGGGATNYRELIDKLRAKFPQMEQRAAGDGGSFWFYDPSNIELLVKALGSTTLNDRYWVFAGALTNVETRINVDQGAANKVPMLGDLPVLGDLFRRGGETDPGRRRLFLTVSPAITDTNAFATCP